jgi:hypothetical protein
MPPADIKAKIAEQRGFLSRSVKAYLAGQTAEALRIATTIRVLVHETRNSTPLLKYFRADYLNLPIIDRHLPNLENFDKPGGRLNTYISVGFGFQEKDLLQFTDLASPEVKMATIGEWWAKRCLIFTDSGQRIEYRRRDLLLILANKEGGAHVDTMLPARYEDFMLNSAKLTKDDGETEPIHLARFAALEAAVQMIDCLDRNVLSPP